MDFAAFWRAYEELIVKVRTQQDLTRRLRGHHVHDHQPRDDRHRALGAPADARTGLHPRRRQHRLPRRVRGRRPAALAQLGVSKVTTLTNTYDHRIITGAESGEFLRRIHELLLGDDGFYDDVFAQPRGARTSRPAGSPTAARSPTRAAQNEKVVQVHSLINMYRVRGHLIANLDPLGRRVPDDPPRARHHPPRPLASGTSTASSRSATSAPAASPRTTHAAARHPRRAARRVRAHRRRRVHAHPGARPEGVDPGAGRGPHAHRRRRRRSAASSSGSTRRRRSSGSCTRSTSGRSASASKARRRSCPCSTRSAPSAADAGMSRRRARHGAPWPAERARQRDRQVVRADLPRVRGRARPVEHPGLGRREVPPRRGRQAPVARAATTSKLTLAANPSHLEAVDPVVEGMARAESATRLADDARTRGAPGARARRRRVRRPGRGRRDLQPLGGARLRGRRHRPHRRQQPARVHDRARARAVRACTPPTSPRWCRRRSST